jgi:hypothetical protein
VEFKPWEDYKDVCPITLDIKEPPCKHCKKWSPRIVTDPRGDYHSVRLCTSGYMRFDFSCYQPKEGRR